MKTSTRMFHINAIDLRNLDEEHTEIDRLYAALEDVILRGRGLPRILAAANSLVQMVLLHFTHEEQFLERLSLSGIQQRQRDATMKISAQLFDIEAGLQSGKVGTVFHLLRLGRVWMREHMHRESAEFIGQDSIEEIRPIPASQRHLPGDLPLCPA